MRLTTQKLKDINLKFDEKSQTLKKDISSIQKGKFNSKEENIRIEQLLSLEREQKKKKGISKIKCHYEENEQITLMQQINICFPKISDILIHIPNGGSRKGGVIEGARFKRLGVKAGVSDLFLPLARHNKHGLWIEFKAAKPHHSPVSKKQQEWIDKMLENGYAAYVCYGVDEALNVLKEYLKI